jgi:hypothetical protein
MGELADPPEENFTAEYLIFLGERLMQGGNDEVDAVAELVIISSSTSKSFVYLTYYFSSPKAHLEQGAMIQKVSKAASSIGLPRRDKISFLLSRAT